MRFPLSTIVAAATLTLAACETVPPPPPPPPPQAGPSPYVFRSSDFTWSAIPGPGRIDARLVYRQGATSYVCTNAVLIPEAPFSARRMITLYGSAVGAILPMAEVQSRNTAAPAGFNDFVRSTTCDAQGRFSFQGLPDGAWFVVTVARPSSGGGAQTALMRRVATRGAKAVAVDL